MPRPSPSPLTAEDLRQPCPADPSTSASSAATTSPKWSGQCAECEAWNTLVETVLPGGGRGTRGGSSRSGGGRAGSAAEAASARVEAIAAVSSAEAERLASGIGEVDRVLGGGLVPGSIVLLGGDPGIGKSTLLLQLAARLARTGAPVLYVTGEESSRQVRGRAERVDAVVEGLSLLATTELETAVDVIVGHAAGARGRRQRPDPGQR